MATKLVRPQERKRQAVTPINTRAALLLANPNLLKDRLYHSLITQNESDRSAFCLRLITALSAARINVHNHLLLLGCNAIQAHDVTANDIALLVRYYRVNQPTLLDTVANVLDEFPIVKQAVGSLESEELAA